MSRVEAGGSVVGVVNAGIGQVDQEEVIPHRILPDGIDLRRLFDRQSRDLPPQRPRSNSCTGYAEEPTGRML